ncbi:uncharacterized protein LOC124408231 [Diprion similis]|uniref:uncharacterized protein LOC124408231 n=1 Tax=Diprion similis TaxID=362088 RepID=UPI001EF85F8E|nr:uncharacterized protein LOC124408231 [Diprion similis]
MKITIVELLLIAATATAIEWTDLRVTWKSPSLDPCHLSSYYQMPRTKADAISDGWVEVSGVTSLNLAVYCREGDGRVCLEYDTYGNIAAVQAAILYSDIADLQCKHNLSIYNHYQIKTIFNQKYLAGTVYFISPEIIAAGGRCKTNGLTGSDGIWIETKDGYMKIHREISRLDSAWTKENCVPTMGTHYFYGMDKSSECSALQPWFLLAQDGQLSGVGLQGFGQTTYRTRNYYETIPLAFVKSVIPTAPECFMNWAAEYGVISMHIYFSSQPWEIQC